MLETILVLFVASIVVISIIASKKPDEFRTTRSLAINAPASAVFPHINNLNKFGEWNPWAKLEPTANTIFAGEGEGVGAIMSWEGKKIGAGAMICTQSNPNDFVQFRMEFLKPMKATNTAEFTITENQGQSLVTWSMYGPNNFIGKVMSLFMDCDKMIGEQFEKGLQSLKQIVESR